MSASEADDLESALRGRARRRRVVLSVLFALFLLALAWMLARTIDPELFRPRYSFAPAEQEELRAIAGRYRDSARAVDRAWHGALPALTTLAPRADLGRCAFQLPRPDPPEALGASVLPEPAPWGWVEGRTVEEIGRAKSGESERLLERSRELEETATRELFDRAQLARLLGDARLGPRPWREVTFLLTAATPPTATATGQYGSGLVQGTAYVFDAAQSAFVCGAEVTARNQSDIPYLRSFAGGAAPTNLASLRSSLEADLRYVLYRTIAESLVRLGPRTAQ